MLTIFTVPKPFKGHINIIQRNAIQSWLKLCPECEVILFGNDQGVAEAAAEFGVKHIPDVLCNEFGTPFLDSIFRLAQKTAKNQILVHVSSDIVLFNDFIPAIKMIKKPLFLMGGGRWDFNLKEPINFNEHDWQEKLRKRVTEKGRLRGLANTDYLIYPRNFPHNLPSFVVGRPGWDNWLIYHTRSLKIPVIDATTMITAVHQNHGYSHSPWGQEGKFGGRVEGPEFKKNVALAGGSLNMFTLVDADWILASDGPRRPEFPRIVLSKLSLFYFWRIIRVIRRKLRRVFP